MEGVVSRRGILVAAAVLVRNNVFECESLTRRSLAGVVMVVEFLSLCGVIVPISEMMKYAWIQALATIIEIMVRAKNYLPVKRDNMKQMMFAVRSRILS